MGDPAHIGFKIDGQNLLAYSHWGGYPESQGIETLTFARHVADWDALREVVRGLIEVDSSAFPNADELAQYHAQTGGQYHDNQVGGKNDWYALLRNTQGNLGLILKSGYIANLNDNSMPDYTFLIDLDSSEFISYDGDTRGKVLSRYPLDALPDDATYLASNTTDY
jgi:hypothetical protein